MVRIGIYNYEKSTRPLKKLMVRVGNKVIHFGDTRYGHFKDKTGIWKSLDHGDKARRKQYRQRTANIRDGDGELTRNDPHSANYHARRVLW